MPTPLYVLGHKNPDSDSICAAIGYTALLHAQGQSNAVAARQGALRPETAYVLEYFGVASPRLVTDVRLRVADVMTSPAVSVHQETSLYEVGQLLEQHGIRAVPVVDDEGRLCGVTVVEDFAHSFISGLTPETMDRVTINIENVRKTLDGRILVSAPERMVHDRVMVGAMRIDSMLARIARDILLVIGDRTDAQRAAIEFGVGALVVTGDLPVEEEILQLAREHHVTVMSVAHHTYTTVRLIQLSTAVRHIMRREVATCQPDDLAEEVLETLRAGQVRALVVVDAERKVVGMISRSNLLRAARPQLVLVDHNERSQSVTGIEEADVIGVIDHHRVSDFQTRTPPFMRIEPVGACSTIVAKLFAEAHIPVPPPVAGVLLAGILSDTLLFHGPTTTQEDRDLAAALASRAGVGMEELGAAILRRASDVTNRSADELLMTDFKEFVVDDARFGIGTIETASGADVLARRDELLTAMETLHERGSYTSVIFGIIDIVKVQTILLVVGHPEAVAATFEMPLVDGALLYLPAILSRKKHIVPLLGAVASRIGRR